MKIKKYGFGLMLIQLGKLFLHFIKPCLDKCKIAEKAMTYKLLKLAALVVLLTSGCKGQEKPKALADNKDAKVIEVTKTIDSVKKVLEQAPVVPEPLDAMDGFGGGPMMPPPVMPPPILPLPVPVESEVIIDRQTLLECGNGELDEGEECDDGNLINTDACTNYCQEAACLDGFLQAGEECDDGNNINNDFCTTLCLFAVCGDSIIQFVAGETCDDGNTVTGDGCSSTCVTEQTLESFNTCGDGIIQAPETCDDGNSIPNDGCTNNCLLPACGDGNLDNSDGCTTSCRLPTCGDGIIQLPEACDDGNLVNNDGCTNNCLAAVCGDGIVQGEEACDDGNFVNNDECSNTCQAAVCGDGIIQPILGERCDTISSVPGTGCDAFCVLTETDCTDGLDNDNDGLFNSNDPDCAALIFATSASFSGDLVGAATNYPACAGVPINGLARADCICQQTALLSTNPAVNNPSLTWLAYLSDSANTNPAAGMNDTIYKNTVGQLIAASLSDLTSGNVSVAVTFDENGNPLIGPNATWTGVGGQYCQDWTSSLDVDAGSIGDVNSPGNFWQSITAFPCGNPQNPVHLYCLQSNQIKIKKAVFKNGLYCEMPSTTSNVCFKH